MGPRTAAEGNCGRGPPDRPRRRARRGRRTPATGWRQGRGSGETCAPWLPRHHHRTLVNGVVNYSPVTAAHGCRYRRERAPTLRSRRSSTASISSFDGKASLNVPAYLTNSAIRRRRLNSSSTLHDRFALRLRLGETHGIPQLVFWNINSRFHAPFLIMRKCGIPMKHPRGLGGDGYGSTVGPGATAQTPVRGSARHGVLHY